jgi:Concanavalin A-like lectin/glucanases superfamily
MASGENGVPDMSFDRRWSRMMIPVLAAFPTLISIAAHAAQDDFAAAVVAAHPLAYYRLDSTAGKSQVGATTYKSLGAVASVSPGAPIGSNSFYVKLDGRTGYITTTQSGGIGTAASIMAWINLADLPSRQGHILYVAGESQNGNDFDLQFEPDNKLKFFTAGGGSIDYAPPLATLANQWHLIVVTLDTVSKTRMIYWDGKPVSVDKGGGTAGKTALFTIGESPVFTGRFLKGGIEDAALWNRALKANEVAAIYEASKTSGAATATGPASANATGTEVGAGQFPTSAKVEVDDSKGHIQLKRPEQIAIMFLTAIQNLEGECQRNTKRACTLDQLLPKLKFDPRTDPNYTYTVASAGAAWEAHATAKKAGLIGFCFLSRSYPSVTATFSASGTAGFVDSELMGRSIEGDTFAR